MRRFIDVVASGAALIMLAPLLTCLALLVRILDGPPVFFHQWRAGLHAVPFRMIKFRTMRRDAEKSGGVLTFREDRRITPFGRLLRRCKLDELPQLLNVFRGEMTLIGPRPEVLAYVERYTPEQREVLLAKPGLSDPVQLLFRHEQDFLSSGPEYEQLMPIKVRKQIEYLRNRTIGSDVAVAVRTLRAMLPSKPSQEEMQIYALIGATRRPDTG